MPDFETLDVKLDGQIALVELNRPEKANAMNPAMWSELQVCFDLLSDDPKVRAVVLSGAGKHFCSGIDLDMFWTLFGDETSEASRRSETLRRTILQLQGNLSAIENCRKPVLAAIHGSCIGGGLDMVSCCDMRYCSFDAVFSIKEVDIGMTADVGSLQRLPHIISQGILRELAYTGRDVTAEEAYEIGLVNRVFDSREEMLSTVIDLAKQIATKSPLAVRGTKEMLNYSRDHSIAEGLNYIATWNAGMLSAGDLMKAVTARANKQVPEFDD